MTACKGAREMRALVHAFGGRSPVIDADAFVAPGAVVIGDVRIKADASIWHGCIVRGDVEPVSIGEGSNVQDGSVVHADPGFPVRIGSHVLVGHMALLHGCTVQDRGFVGMGAMVMNEAVVESDAMLAAGAMLTEGKVVPSGQLWAGRPARYMRDLNDAEIGSLGEGTRHYIAESRAYRAIYGSEAASDDPAESRLLALVSADTSG